MRATRPRALQTPLAAFAGVCPGFLPAGVPDAIIGKISCVKLLVSLAYAVAQWLTSGHSGWRNALCSTGSFGGVRGRSNRAAFGLLLEASIEPSRQFEFSFQELIFDQLAEQLAFAI